MDIGDIVFYVVIIASVVGSIVKRFPGKATNTSKDGSGDVQESPIKKILEEINKWDDYIPSTPKTAPVPQNQNRPMAQPAAKTSKSQIEMKRKNVEKPYLTPEAGAIGHAANMASNVSSELKIEETETGSIIDLSDVDEFKKAIIYSEILNPKYGFSSKNS